MGSIFPLNKSDNITAGLIIAGVVLSGLLGYYIANIGPSQAQTQVAASGPVGASQPATTNRTVNLDIIADWGGAGYDAFVLASNLGNSPPTPATNTTDPGPNDNNVTVPVNTSVKFVITTTDTAVLENFTGPVTTPFLVYNDTDSGQVGLQYNSGQSVNNLPIGHTFTISDLGVNIPIPPTTAVSFSLSFSKPGTYMYFCQTPCGPGMNVVGYMMGYIIVK